MSDRRQRPTDNRRPNPEGSAPPEPEAETATSEPAAMAAQGPPEPVTRAAEPAASDSPDERTEAAAPGGREPPASARQADAITPREEPPAAARDYPELSEPAGEPSGAARFGEKRTPTPLPEATPPAAPPAEASYRGLALGLAATLLLVLALIATAPFWAPLLPWGEERPGIDPAVVERLDAQQQRIGRLEQQATAASAAVPRLEQRVDALEQKPPPPSPDLGEIRQQIAAAASGLSELTPRVERLESSTQAQAGALSDLKTGLEQLGKTTQAQAAGLSDLKADLEQLGKTQQVRQQAQAADLAAKLDPLTQGLQAQQAAVAALGNRLQTFEKTAQSRAGDLTDMGLMLALMQIRNAVESGRSFPAEYNALSSLAKKRPEIAAAAAPLADASRTGTADRVELAQELSALAQQIDASPAAAGSDGGWIDAVLGRLRGLVRVRRADEAEPGKQEAAAIAVAERALAGGDLPRAVAAIETLQGPGQGPLATTASDWLRKARERLAVEAALHRLEALLTARLGDTAPTPSPAPGAPG